MFIVENRNSRLSKRTWIWRCIIFFLLFPSVFLTMHVYYNPDK